MAKPKKVNEIQAPDANRTRCAYVSDGLRCRYPGTLSPVNWNGEGEHPGPWYCRMHWQCHSHVVGDDVVQASQDYEPAPSAGGLHPDAAQARQLADAKASAAAASYCEQHGLTTVAQMRAFVRARIGSIGRGK